MKVVALISGGKDSCYNMMQCIAAGHEIVALANLTPHSKTEIDSYMYQSVGFEAIDLIAESMELPLFRDETFGKSYQQGKIYEPTDDDEVEDLFKLLHDIKSKISFDAVSVGAILSDYQRIRVENICVRLGLVPLAYLWQRNQDELLQEMIKCEIDAIIIKVAALGLEPSRHLGRPLRLVEPHLQAMHEKYGLNICGEGGEYETLTLDCPLFKSRIVIEESEVIIHSDDPIAPVGYLKFNKLKLELKLPALDLDGRLSGLPLKDCDGYVTDYGEEATEIQEDSDETDVPIIDNSFTTNIIINDSDICQSTNSAKSANGWLWIGGIRGESENPYEAIKQAMEKLKYELSVNNQTLEDVCSISMFISDMSQYLELNKLYCETLNHVNPPTRACVQVPLPKHCPVIMEAVSWNARVAALPTGDLQSDRQTIHVQSISHWAPANIGPYSQAVKIGDLVHLAGQIGLVPGSMQLVKGGIKQQCQLALRHVGRLLKAMDPNINLRETVQGICYVSNVRHIEDARKLWEEKTNNSIMDYVVVSNLPRNALVEWHVWAHTHNHQFEYEETGKCIEDWSISIYRRWNYENNTAAIVCHVDNSIQPDVSASLDIFNETLEYVLHKLQQNHEYVPNSICALKIFYPFKKEINTQGFCNALAEADKTIALSYTIVPVIALKSEHTALSICGIRIQ